MAAPQREDVEAPGEDQQQLIPRGLVPWLIPMLVVLGVVAIGVLGLAGLGVLLVALVVICLTPIRTTRRQSYYELRRNDPFYGSIDDFRKGRGYMSLDQGGPSD